MRYPIVLSLALSAGLHAAAPARAETVDCIPITSLPATIATQGVYCLKKDLTTSIASGSALTIATNNVTLDCNHFKIGGLGGGPASAAIGIRAQGRANVMVRNCSLRGFNAGVWLTGSGHAVEGNRFDGILSAGIMVHGDNGVVRGNRIFDTGGASGTNRGIETAGSVDVVDNTISGVESGSAGYAAAGILSLSNLGASITGNIVRGVEGDNGSYAIFVSSSPRASVRRNTIFGPSITGTTTGIQCYSGMAVAADNQVLGFDAPLSGCSATGANSVF